MVRKAAHQLTFVSATQGFNFDGLANVFADHTLKDGRLYRYYVSQVVLKQGREDCPVGRLPAAEIEAAVIDQVRGLLRAPEIVAWRASKPQVDSIDVGERGFDLRLRIGGLAHRARDLSGNAADIRAAARARWRRTLQLGYPSSSASVAVASSPYQPAVAAYPVQAGGTDLGWTEGW